MPGRARSRSGPGLGRPGRCERWPIGAKSACSQDPIKEMDAALMFFDSNQLIEHTRMISSREESMSSQASGAEPPGWRRPCCEVRATPVAGR